MADLMLNFDISGMEGGASVHLLEFLRVFLCEHYIWSLLLSLRCICLHELEVG